MNLIRPLLLAVLFAARVLVLGALAMATTATAAPVTVQNLTTFQGSGDEAVWPRAAWPFSPPIQVEERLYGTTMTGVYSMPLYRGQYEVPDDFRDALDVGSYSSGPLVWDQEEKTFYGVNRVDVSADANGFLFKAEFDGANPSRVLDLIRPTGVLVLEGRTLYGLDRGPDDHGRLFAVDLDQQSPSLRTVYTFSEPPAGISQTPNGMILGSDGRLYGLLAYARGAPYMAGTPTALDTPTGAVYRLDPASPESSFEILHTFTLDEGEIPWHDCIGETCSELGDNGAPTAQTCIDNLCFSSDENNVLAWLVEGPDGFLYGGTTLGNCKARTTEPRTDSWDSVVYHPLCHGREGVFVSDYSDPPRGTPPYYDGPNWHGSLYRLKKDGTDFALLHTFSGTDGSQPRGPMAVGNDGNIYGTTLGGGQSSSGENSYNGTLYRLVPDDIRISESGEVRESGFESLHSFSRDIDGHVPVGVTSSDGVNLYGATYRNGEPYLNRVGNEVQGQGTTFKVLLDPDAPQASVTVTLSSGDIDSGESARVIWTSQYADRCTASGGAEGDNWSGPREPEGYQDITPPPGTYYYTLTCESTLTGGQIGDVASLGVGAPDRAKDGDTREYGNGSGGSAGLVGLALLGLLVARRRGGRR